mmetsp:Transcript_89286/g.193255  ORF Transcript_89286/g.193255 Transcript_89286/m.193255 type:complete len:84 (-) Transcript_89286:35-286(-)
MSQIVRRTGIFSLRGMQVRFGTNIRVLLLDNVVNRGQKGEVVKVKRGYFRNFLYPRKMAVYATDINLERYKYLLKSPESESSS